jgi:hypothetical protein
LSALRPTPNLEGQVPVFKSPSDKVAELYPSAPGSFFVAFYDSQDCDGSILTHHYTGAINKMTDNFKNSGNAVLRYEKIKYLRSEILLRKNYSEI